MTNSAPSTAIKFSNTNLLSSILTDCWTSLDNATKQRDCGWRLPILATMDASAGIRQRIVVLRSVDTQQRRLMAHTDLRSPKVAALRKNMGATWLFYDHSAMTQLQVSGVVSVHNDDKIADQVWQSEPESSLRGYMAPLAPGSVCESADFNLPESVVGRIPDRNELTAARANFAVIQCHVESIEWLRLNRDGNLRARFRYTNGDVEAEWLTP